MKILLLGATGRTGKLVLKKLLEKKCNVTCISRNSQRIEQRKGLTILEGDPRDLVDMQKVIFESDGIISVLNISRNSDFPWSNLRTPKTFLSDTMKVLVPLAQKAKIKRIVVCSAWGVLESRHDIPKWFRWLIDNSNIKFAYQDHERQEKIISESTLRWTVVRPVGLTNSKRMKSVRESFDNRPKPGLVISRSSLAQYLADSVRRDDLIGKKVVISSG